ncbi:hypothetical protein ACFFX0_30055 [Citricoccus parietis]|uniref:Uncharacterized protein n=1 Tax=Citricoccus parietis TaxID=592307 RepID=A0ABV5G8G6_9MICC
MPAGRRNRDSAGVFPRMDRLRAGSASFRDEDQAVPPRHGDGPRSRDSFRCRRTR